jgi:hypothetical protein
LEFFPYRLTSPSRGCIKKFRDFTPFGPETDIPPWLSQAEYDKTNKTESIDG